MKMKSKGKDTTTGHWELMGLVLDKPFKTYKKFPDELISKFIERTDCKNILGNKPASGTKIIEEYNAVHTRSKFPIIYTSADRRFGRYFLLRNLTRVIKGKEECIVRYTHQREIFLPKNLTNVIFARLIKKVYI